MVSDGHKTDDPAIITYPIVVPRGSIRIDFLIDPLNDLDICACNTGNAYLNENCSEKIWTVVGKYFGPSYRVLVMIIGRDVYGLKSI